MSKKRHCTHAREIFSALQKGHQTSKSTHIYIKLTHASFVSETTRRDVLPEVNYATMNLNNFQVIFFFRDADFFVYHVKLLTSPRAVS